MGIRQYLYLAAFVAYTLAVWHAHTIYDGYRKAKEEKAIIDTRVTDEQKSNKAAAVTVAREADDEARSKASSAELQKRIETNRHGYDCVVPADGVRALQQAVAAHTRAR